MSERARTIDTLLDERRTFAPSPEVLAKARVKDQSLFEAAAADPGDGARIDEDGYFWFMGRVDDVMNVAGHRISTAEVESALVDHPAVAEAGVVAKSDPETGQAISAFVRLRAGYKESTELIAELRDHVAKLIGAIAKPKWIAFTPDLPKTRSGKIMRRLLRDIAENRKLGDTTTLADSSIVADLQRRATQEEAKEQ
jgi:acetyl-CoA synthetase